MNMSQIINSSLNTEKIEVYSNHPEVQRRTRRLPLAKGLSPALFHFTD